MNLGSSKDLPELGQVWENIKAMLEGKKRMYGVQENFSLGCV
jgi:hypothetical protein